MRTFLFIFLISGLLYAKSPLYAQNTDEGRATVLSDYNDLALKPAHNFGATLLGLNYAYEEPIAKNLLLRINGYLGSVGLVQYYTYNSSSYSLSASSNISVLWGVDISLNLRWIYNRENLLARGKSIDLNSGNFLNTSLKYISSFESQNIPSFSILSIPTVCWGLRRDLRSNFYFEFDLGIGMGFSLSSSSSKPSISGIYPMLDLSFGYVLNGKNK